MGAFLAGFIALQSVAWNAAPAGTPLHVRLTHAVGSYASRPHSRVEAVLIAPVKSVLALVRRGAHADYSDRAAPEGPEPGGAGQGSAREPPAPGLAELDRVLSLAPSGHQCSPIGNRTDRPRSRSASLSVPDRQEIAAVERIRRLDNSLIVHGNPFDHLAQHQFGHQNALEILKKRCV